MSRWRCQVGGGKGLEGHRTQAHRLHLLLSTSAGGQHDGRKPRVAGVQSPGCGADMLAVLGCASAKWAATGTVTDYEMHASSPGSRANSVTAHYRRHALSHDVLSLSCVSASFSLLSPELVADSSQLSPRWAWGCLTGSVRVQLHIPSQGRPDTGVRWCWPRVGVRPGTRVSFLFL